MTKFNSEKIAFNQIDPPSYKWMLNIPSGLHRCKLTFTPPELIAIGDRG